MKRLAILTAFFVAGTLSGQTMTQPTSGTQMTTTTTYTLAPTPDVEVQSLSVTPHGGILAGSWVKGLCGNFHDCWRTPAPTSNVVAVIRNRGTAALTNVTWKIFRGPYQDATGAIAQLDPGATAQANTTFFVINPTWGDTVWEARAAASNEPALRQGPENSRTFTQTLREANITWRKLAYTWTKDRYADAFSIAKDVSFCSTSIGEAAFASDYDPVNVPYGHGFPTFKLDCRNTFSGARATAEAFKNITLKNGWVVRMFGAHVQWTTIEGNNCTNYAGWSWATQPGATNFTNNPYTSIKLWADAGCAVTVKLNVSISGPDHLNPFQ